MAKLVWVGMVEANGEKGEGVGDKVERGSRLVVEFAEGKCVSQDTWRFWIPYSLGGGRGRSRARIS